MTRTLPAGFLASVQSEDSTALIWLMSFAFSGGTTRICTAAQDIEFGGNTYTAVGGNMKAGPIQESGDAGAGVELTLSGVDTTLIAEILGETYIGRTCEIKRAHGDPTTGLIIADDSFAGQMSGGFNIVLNRGGDFGGTATVKARIVSQFARLRYRQGTQHNPQSMNRRYPDDLGFEFVAFTASRSINWGGSIEEFGNRGRDDQKLGPRD